MTCTMIERKIYIYVLLCVEHIKRDNDINSNVWEIEGANVKSP